MKKMILKYKMFLKYIIISMITSSINIIIYVIMSNIWSGMYILSNVFSWTISTFIIFILNKKIVFKDNLEGSKIVLKQIIYFYIIRLSSLFIDSLILQICIKVFNINYIFAKIISNFGTIFNNYLISKHYIFK